MRKEPSRSATAKAETTVWLVQSRASGTFVALRRHVRAGAHVASLAEYFCQTLTQHSALP